MKTIFAVLCLFALSAAARSDDGTVSVLKTASSTATQTSTPTVAQTAAPVAVQTAACSAPVAVQTVACCSEEARAVKLSPWHTRRLNRIADRQEAREARGCCDACNDGCDCCKKPKALVVEAKVKKCRCK